METSSWKCLKDGSAAKAKCWRFSIALLSLVNKREREKRTAAMFAKSFDQDKWRETRVENVGGMFGKDKIKDEAAASSCIFHFA